MARQRIWTVLQTIVILAVVAITLGQIVGQPTLLSYVTSNSMHPTISTGDGFIVLPSLIAGPVEKGDIIVFHAKTLHGGDGALTTHRVVGKTDHGFITKGKNNPFTDQDGGEPPVKRVQIVGQAVLIGESPIVIPNLGTAVTGVRGVLTGTQRVIATTFGARWLLGTRGIAYILIGIGGLVYVGSVLREHGAGPRRRKRSRKRNRRRGGLMPRQVPKWIVAVGLGCLLIASLTITMTVAGGVHEFGVVSAEGDGPGPRVIPAGNTEQLTYTVPNGGVIPIVAYVDAASEGVSTPSEGVYVPPGGEQTISVKLSAPEKIGYYPRYTAEYRYLAILPQSWIHSLYSVHPWLPIVVIDALVLGGFLAVAIPLLGSGSYRKHQFRSPLMRRLRRILR